MPCNPREGRVGGGRYAAELARAQKAIRALVFLSSGLGASTEATLAGLADRPMLGVASERDSHGRAVQSTRELFEFAEHPASRLILYKGQAHGTPLFAVDPDLQTLIAEWLARQLNP